MNPTMERIRTEAKTLSQEQRETLLAALDFDLRGHDVAQEDPESEVSAAWDTEIQQRVTDVESGKVELLSYAEFSSVFDEARAELRRSKQA
jgi:Putative addiction module component